MRYEDLVWMYEKLDGAEDLAADAIITGRALKIANEEVYGRIAEALGALNEAKATLRDLAAEVKSKEVA